MATETKQKIATAHLSFLRQTPRKVRRTANLVRLMTAGEATEQLKFSAFAAAEPLRKLIMSAMANAKNNLGVETPEELQISQLLVDENNTYKRWRAMNKGRAYTILKRTAKISVVLSEMNAAEYSKFVWDNSPRNKKNPINKAYNRKAKAAEAAETKAPKAKTKATTTAAKPKKTATKKEGNN